MGIVAYSFYNYRKKSAGTATSLYVIHTRMAAQGLVITLLTGSVCLHMLQKIWKKNEKSSMPPVNITTKIPDIVPQLNDKHWEILRQRWIENECESILAFLKCHSKINSIHLLSWLFNWTCFLNTILFLIKFRLSLFLNIKIIIYLNKKNIYFIQNQRK